MGIDFSPAVAQVRGIINGLVRLLPNLAIALVLFLIFIVVAPLVRRLVERTARGYGKHPNLSEALGRLTQALFILLGFLVSAVILFPEFSAGDLLSVLGFGSVAIGFAFRDILQNFLAGILLLITEPLRVGDQIIFGDYEGNVEHIETRATYLRTYDGRRVVIPNGDLYTGTFIVNTAYDKRRMDVDIEIRYENDLEEAEQILLETVLGVEGVLHDPPPEVLVTEMRQAAANLRVRWWVTPPMRHDVLVSRDKVLRHLKAALQEGGLSLPLAVQQIVFVQEENRRSSS